MDQNSPSACAATDPASLNARGSPRTTIRLVLIQVRLFAGLRERAGTDRLQIEVADDARVADVLAAMAGTPVGEIRPKECVVAVNREYADADEPVNAGDEVALVPPVSGGESPVRHIRVTAEPLDLSSLAAAVRDPRAGGVVLFEGVTRDVPELDYEAYAEMAQTKLEQIAAEEAERHGLCAVAIEHRTGAVALSEPSVIVAASAPHRGEAFAGARALIDRVKAEAPIWKVEVDGADRRRVEGTLPPT
jgi:MoaE-MoaD fusion protein